MMKLTGEIRRVQKCSGPSFKPYTELVINSPQSASVLKLQLLDDPGFICGDEVVVTIEKKSWVPTLNRGCKMKISLDS